MCDNNTAYFCNGKVPTCDKTTCYIFKEDGGCYYTTNPEYRLSPIIIDGVEITTRFEYFGDKRVEVFNNSLSIAKEDSHV